ncbi:MAG: ABC transporter substrate-binding protein [Rhodospirillales bacterium]|nr:ABC transporter substrate-binding protein [Rhodospirillales bacterium]
MLTRRSVLAASAASPVLASLGAEDALAATPKNIVVMGKTIDDIVAFDPAQSYEFSDNEIDGNCYNKLVTPDLTTGTTVVGDAAESWTVSPDGRTITFKIRPGIKFASGNALTAHDAAFSLQRVVKLNLTPGFIITQFGYTKDNVEKLITTPDAMTLKLELPKQVATSFVLFCLSANVGCIVDRATVMSHQKNGDLGNDWLKTHTAGSGPYQLISWVASEHVILEANPHSALKAGVPRIVIQHIPEPASQLLQLEKGSIDIARDLLSDNLKQLAGKTEYTVLKSGQATSVYIGMNMGKPHLDKTEVHQAIKWAIDYEGIAKNIVPGTYEIAQNFLPAGLPGALTDMPFKRDVAKAKQLLAQAGYAKGFSVTMDHIAAAPYNDIAQAVQANLKEIGITVKLLPAQAKQVFTKMRARQHELIMSVWGSDYFDPNSNAQAFCADPDDSDKSTLKILAWRCHFHNVALTKMVEDAVKELDDKKRIAMYEDMQRQFRQIAPFAMMLQQNVVAVLGKGVSGLKVGPMPDYTKYADIRKA